MLKSLLILTWFTVVPPPAQYMQEYQGELHVHYGLSHTEMDHACRVRGQAYGLTVACTYMENLPERCDVFLPRVGDTYMGRLITPELLKEILQHELAHCNRWPVTHPRETEI